MATEAKWAVKGQTEESLPDRNRKLQLLIIGHRSLVFVCLFFIFSEK